MKRKSPLKRYTPLKRGTKRIPARSKARASVDRVYAELRRAYLEEHPLCQATIFEHGLEEASAIVAYQIKDCPGDFIRYAGHTIPRATEIHHRNKSNGRRKIDERFWLAVCLEMHERIEENKRWARGFGLLLPINADPEGRAAGVQHPTTPGLLAAAHDEASNTPPVDL